MIFCDFVYLNLYVLDTDLNVTVEWRGVGTMIDMVLALGMKEESMDV